LKFKISFIITIFILLIISLGFINPVRSSHVTNQPPILADLPDLCVEKGFNDDLIDLSTFVSDPDDDIDHLTFSIISETNDDVIDCLIDQYNNIDCLAEEDSGVSQVTVQVNDGVLIDTNSFKVTVCSGEEDNTEKKHRSTIRKFSISSLFSYDEGDYFAVYAKIKNTGNVDSDIKVRLTIPEANFYDVRNIDLSPKQAKWATFYLDAPEGRYVATLEVINEKGSKIKYLEIEKS